MQGTKGGKRIEGMAIERQLDSRGHRLGRSMLRHYKYWLLAGLPSIDVNQCTPRLIPRGGARPRLS
jgi:hypothetical protein